MSFRIDTWRDYFASSRADPPPIVTDSWIRNREAGLERTQAPVSFRAVPPQDLEQRVHARRSVLLAARPVLDALRDDLGKTTHVCYLVDEDGIVLYSTGPELLQRSYCLLPGYDWSEACMGTNGAGTALVEERPVAVVGAEHYFELFGGCTCTAAPIFDQDGKLVGAIDVSCAVEHAQPSQLERVRDGALEISAALGMSDGGSATGGSTRVNSVPSGRSVRWHMSRLLAIALLPLVVAVAFIGWRQWADARFEAAQRLGSATVQAAVAIESELAEIRAVLETLTTSDAILAGDWQSVYRRGLRVVEGRPDYLIALTDDTGQLLFNTAMPWGAELPNLWKLDAERRTAMWQGSELPLSSQGLTRRVIEQGQAETSGLYFGVSVRRPAFSMAVPVLKADGGRLALTLSLPPDALAERLRTMGQEDGIGLLVIDGGRRVVATNRVASQVQGELLDREVIAGSSASTQREERIVRTGGRNYASDSRPLAQSNWTVVALWPQELAHNDAREAALGAAGILISLLGFTLVAVGRLAQQITEGLKDLVPPHDDGRLRIVPHAAGSGILEIEQLRHQLDVAARAERRRALALETQAQAEHREALAWASERAIRRILENVHVLLAVLDADGCIQEINQPSLLGSDSGKADLVGIAFWKCLCWAHDTEVRERIRMGVETAYRGYPVRFDAPTLHGSGSVKILDLQLAPVMEDGRISYIIVSAVDVSEREHARSSLVEANQSIRQLNQRKDEFLAMMAHELRNPLGPLKASSYILDHANPSSPPAQKARAVIGRQIAHLAHLVDDLLDANRFAHGKVELRRSWIDLSVLVRRSVEDQLILLDRSGSHRPKLRAELPEQALWVYADEVRVDQLVRNLLDNAVKFTSVGGAVVVRLEHHLDTACLSVTDSGIGMDAALLERLFEPFAQGSNSSAAGRGGLGLGLAIVKGIADMHGWRVSARSDGIGAGSRFDVELSDCRSAPPALHIERERKPLPASTMRVLVVDDNTDGAEAVAELIRLLGHHAEVAHDGKSALDKCMTMRADWVLCDIGLPDIDGYEVARQLRRCGATARLVALTGYGQTDDVQRTLDAGFERHIVKPLAPDVLIQLLEDSE